jgi:hypothetical protein
LKAAFVSSEHPRGSCKPPGVIRGVVKLNILKPTTEKLFFYLGSPLFKACYWFPGQGLGRYQGMNTFPAGVGQ